MRWPSLLIVLVFVLGAARAEALTVRDIIELSKSGLSDEILVALIDVERKVFPVDTATLKQLKEGGVSDRVIVAMVRSGRVPPPAGAGEPAPPVLSERGEAARVEGPQVVVIEHREPAPVRQIHEVREVVVPVPVYVPVVMPHRRGGHVVDQPAVPIAPFSTIGLPHAPLAIHSPTRRRSDPPYWHEMQQPRKE